MKQLRPPKQLNTLDEETEKQKLGGGIFLELGKKLAEAQKPIIEESHHSARPSESMSQASDRNTRARSWHLLYSRQGKSQLRWNLDQVLENIKEEEMQKSRAPLSYRNVLSSQSASGIGAGQDEESVSMTIPLD